MTYRSKYFATTPSPYSWLVVAIDTAIDTERQHYHYHPKSETADSTPEPSQKTTPGALERLLSILSMVFWSSSLNPK